MTHKARQVVEIAPKAIQFFWRFGNRHRLLNADAVPVWDTGGTRHALLPAQFFRQIHAIASDGVVDQTSSDNRKWQSGWLAIEQAVREERASADQRKHALDADGVQITSRFVHLHNCSPWNPDIRDKVGT